MRTISVAFGLAVIFGLLAQVFPPYLQYVGARIAMLIIVTLGLNVLAGNAGLFSLAGPAFMGIGAYGVVTMMSLWDVPLLVAAPIAILVAWMLGWVLGTVSLRLSGFHLGLVTLGFLLTFQLILRRGGQLTSGYYGAVTPPADLFGIPLGPDAWAAIAFGLAAMIAVFIRALVLSRVGRAWRAMRHSELAAELFGVNLLHYKTSAFALSAGLGALSGCIYAFLQGAISPPQFGINGAIDQLTYIVVGGLGSVTGSILGPIVLELTPELLRSLGDKRQLFFAIVLVIMLGVAPTGLAGLASRYGARIRLPWRQRGHREVPLPRVASPSIETVPSERRASSGPVELEFRDVQVAYGGLVALNGLTFSVRRGTIHGLIGPNGAGKTTAINALTGVAGLAQGTIVVGDQEVCNSRKRVRRDRIIGQGIVRTFQTPLVVPTLSAVENTMLGLHSSLQAGLLRSALRGPRVQREESGALAVCLDMLARVGFVDDPFVPTSQLGFAGLRRVELARALVAKPRLLLLDEPTSGLELHSALDTVRMLRSLQDASTEPITILLVEHNVPLVFELCDQVTAMDQGKAIASGVPEDVRRNAQVRNSYLGQSVDQEVDLPVATNPSAQPMPAKDDLMLQLRNLHAGYGKLVVIRDLSLEVPRGKTVGIFGRNGAGKSTLVNAIMGLVSVPSGDVTWDGRSLVRMRTDQIVKRGISLVPQTRGLFVTQTVLENLTLTRFALGVSRPEMQTRLDEAFERFPPLKARRNSLAGSLSGGEQQMLAIAKALIRRPQLLLLDEPSIGLAPRMVEEVAHVVSQLRSEDLTVVVTEQNIPWILALVDTACILDQGAVVESIDMTVRRGVDAQYIVSQYLGRAQLQREVVSSSV